MDGAEKQDGHGGVSEQWLVVSDKWRVGSDER